jgi:hypothetical protein
MFNYVRDKLYYANYLTVLVDADIAKSQVILIQAVFLDGE